jgi:hypothetical protein
VKVSDSLGVVRPRSSRHTAVAAPGAASICVSTHLKADVRGSSCDAIGPRTPKLARFGVARDDPSALSSADTDTGPEDAFGLVYDAAAGMVLCVSSTFSDEVTLL